MKKTLAAATAVALACSGVVSTTTAIAQESGTFADQFQPEGGITAGHYYTVHAPVLEAILGAGWIGSRM